VFTSELEPGALKQRNAGGEIEPGSLLEETSPETVIVPTI